VTARLRDAIQLAENDRPQSVYEPGAMAVTGTSEVVVAPLPNSPLPMCP